ncbi:MAG: acetyltransferase [Anaerovoracaceae bacterium]
MEKIVLIGAGSHMHSVADSIIRKEEYEIIGFIDKDKELFYRGYSVIGNDNDLESIFESGVKNAFISIGNMGDSKVQRTLYHRLKEIGFSLPSIIDSSAIISEDVVIDEGCFIGKGAIVNTDTRIGKLVTINTAAVIEHDCHIGDFSHIAGNATISGSVKIGDSCLIGAGAVVIENKIILNNVIVGAGSVVIRDCEAGKTYVGNPAREL